MKYKDLNLKKIREDNDLDFAHFTYLKGMCSCCYTPADFPARYWKNNEVISLDDPRTKNLKYILFKNANNGAGIKKRNDDIQDTVYIAWQLPADILENVCIDLQEQFGDEYTVYVPNYDHFTIIVSKLNKYDTDNSYHKLIR